MPALLSRHPWLWVLAALAVVMAFPQTEIGLSGLFFNPVRKIFLLRSHPVGEFVRKTMPVILFALAALVAVLGAAALWRRRPVLGVSWRKALFVLASLALGPGLLVNVVLKDYWGRPRPSTIAEFNGPNTYVLPLVPSDQCLDNCSFPSGHAALAFWMVSFALLAPARWRRPAVGCAVAFGALVGLVRIAQGGHFLSDVLVSGLIVVGLTRWLYGAIIVQSSMTIQKNIHPDTAESP